jgi:RNA polymerase sigma factor (sigma-70 family)
LMTLSLRSGSHGEIEVQKVSAHRRIRTLQPPRVKTDLPNGVDQALTTPDHHGQMLSATHIEMQRVSDRRRARLHGLTIDRKSPGVAVTAFLEGDEASLAALMSCFSPTMSYVARRYVNTRQDVEDALQDTWSMFVRAAGSIENRDAVGGWLCVSVARAALAVAKRSARRQDAERNYGSLASATAEPAPGERDDEAEIVRQVVAELGASDRDLLGLLYGAEVGYAESARLLGRAVGGIGPSRCRALSRLRHDPRIQHLNAA